MRFKTASGAVYDIFSVDGEQYITRDCEIPVVNRMTGRDMETIHAAKVWFGRPPTEGECFHYLTESHGGCVSTAVVEVSA